MGDVSLKKQKSITDRNSQWAGALTGDSPILAAVLRLSTTERDRTGHISGRRRKEYGTVVRFTLAPCVTTGGHWRS